MLGRILLFISIASLFLYSQDHKNKSQKTQQTPNSDQRGTEHTPFVVKTLVPPKTQEEIERDTQDREQKAANDRHVVQLTAALAGIAFLQFLVYAYQAKKLRETVKSSAKQSEAMERHIGEATRSANATEQIANVIKQGNREIMRAYLSITLGGATYQERRGAGQADLMFEARPNMTNMGNTPARKVCIHIKADILDVDKIPTFDFPIPFSEIPDAGVVAPRATYNLTGNILKFVPDDDVATIKEGHVKALCVWGKVTYEDFFGDSHTTKFGQWIFWNPNGSSNGWYIAGQNDMD